MNTTQRLRGIFSPVITPASGDLRGDAAKLVRHCRWLLSQDVGLAVFGTNSEANSMSVAEKMTLLDALIDAGLPAGRMMPGTGCCALNDSVEMTRHAMRHGVGDVLMLPPFFYKGVSDDGLFANFAEVIERVADPRLRIYLYHIPHVSQVPISLSLIERLLKAYPGVIAGVKDSSGDWENTKAMLERFQPQGFDVFCGSETFLLATMRAGGAGCITATGNVNPGAIVRLYRTWRQPDADAQQKALDATRGIFQKFPMIPALKHTVARFAGEAAWQTVRPPLAPLTREQGEALDRELDKRGFTMPGWRVQ